MGIFNIFLKTTKENIMKKLTKRQLELLAITPDNKLKEVFPEFTRAFLRAEKRKLPQKSPEQFIDDDREKLITKSRGADTSKKYQKSLDIINSLQKELDASLEIKKHISTYTINPVKSLKSEATPVIVASDWHYEELVKPSTINGLNSFNLGIADQRIDRFFQNQLRLINISKRDVEIKTIVMALLGDFISGNIHDENLETAQLQPIDAILAVQRKIASGIKFILDNTDCKLVIPCSTGNHPRITQKVHIATETGNSLENLMYHNLAMYFDGNNRVQFVVGEGYHTYLKIYGQMLRFHHGHGMNYGGGVGGIYIPINKAIAQWNKALRADLDVFGHWHQFRDGGNFICNGSLIGYNAYALRIKADYEEPKQAFFLIDKNRGKTIVAPIFVDRN